CAKPKTRSNPSSSARTAHSALYSKVHDVPRLHVDGLQAPCWRGMKSPSMSRLRLARSRGRRPAIFGRSGAVLIRGMSGLLRQGSFRPCSKEMLLDLADGRARERRPELDDFRHLEPRQSSAAPRDELLRGGGDAFFHDHERLDALIPDGIRHSDDRRVEDAR